MIKIKIELNTGLIPLFSGTYESIWDISEVDDNGEELPVDYKHEELMQSIASSYQDNQKYILSELNCPFITSLKFLGTFASPREYNFKTDVLDFEVNINMGKMMEILNSLADSEEFKKFLHDNYSSYDGFMSFTPDNYRDILNEIATEGREFDQAVSALITYMLVSTHKGMGYQRDIEAEVYEDWRGNGYGGLDYKVCDHKLTDYSCKVKKCFNYT